MAQLEGCCPKPQLSSRPILASQPGFPASVARSQALGQAVPSCLLLPAGQHRDCDLAARQLLSLSVEMSPFLSTLEPTTC